MDSKGLSLDGAGVKIYFFTKGSRQLASSRVRAHLIADHLRKLGFDAHSYHVVTRPWWNISIARFSEFWRNLRLVMSLKEGGILYLHKTVYQIDFMFLVLIRALIFKRGYIFDFDDAIWLEKGNMAFKMRIMVRNAKIVIVSNNFLREWVLAYNDTVRIITGLLDTHHIYIPTQKRDTGTITIGWTGSSMHYRNMQLLIGPLQRLVNEGYSIIFMQLGGGKDIYELMASVKGLMVAHISSISWEDPRDVVRHLQTFDVGVYPLQQTQYNCGKNAWKAKEYMACGIPVILSRVGENPEIVADGVNGLLVDSEEDWYKGLKKLITDMNYRRMLGMSGRRYVETECSYDVGIPKLLEAMLYRKEK